MSCRNDLLDKIQEINMKHPSNDKGFRSKKNILFYFENDKKREY